MDAPDMVLYLDGQPGDRSTLRVFVLTPESTDLVLPEAHFEVTFDAVLAQVFALHGVGDESGRLTLRHVGAHTVAVWIDDRIQVAFKFVVDVSRGGGSGGHAGS